MLFNSQCLPLYGAQLWDLRNPDIELLNITWRKCIRYLLGLPFDTRSYLLPYLMKTFNINDVILERQVNFYINMYNHKSNFLSDFTKNVFTSHTSYALSNVYRFVHKFQNPFGDVFVMSNRLVKRAINNHYQNVDWKVSVIIDILHCLDGQTDVGLDRDQLSLILNHVCTDR